MASEPCRQSALSAERRLSTLLEDEFVLLKVLEHLIDDGLHECRRVCRFWYNTCNKLPVKLTTTYLEEDFIQTAIEKFPNCVSFAACVGSDSCIEDKTTGQTGPDGNCGRTLVVFSCLSRLSQLKTLALTCNGEDGPNLNDMLDWSFANSLGECHPTFRQLRSFSIRMYVHDEDEAAHLCSQLRFLTNLTSLELVYLGSWPIKNLTLGPIIELQKIEFLNVGTLVTNRNEQLIFPNLTNLTRLDFDTYMDQFARFDGGFLEALIPYASSLLSINIRIFDPYFRFTDNGLLVKEFSRLESISLYSWMDEINMEPFWRGLKHLRALTSFSTNLFDHMALAMAEHATSLTGLRSLTLDEWCELATLSTILSNTVQLEHLHLRFLWDEALLSHLNGLKELTILRAQGHDMNMDLPRVLVCMPHLEYLKIGSSRAVHIPNSCLSQLKNLEILNLRAVVLDPNPFAGLACLSALKKLFLSRCVGIDNNSLFEVNRLTNLQTLKLLPAFSIDPCSYIEDKLIRLRYLLLPADVLTASCEKELYRRLPSIRRIKRS